MMRLQCGVIVWLLLVGPAVGEDLPVPLETRPAAVSSSLEHAIQLTPDRPTAERIMTAAPNGFDLLAYVDCGTSAAERTGDSPIRALRGASWTWPGAPADSPLSSATFDADEVIYEVAGLRADRDYMLGFTWWDYDQKGRKQSVRWAKPSEPWTTVLPATEAVAYYQDKPTYTLIQLPIVRAYRESDSIRVSFHREGASNAIVNELWLLEKSAASEASVDRLKRIVIVTGDDYPGHRWRQTAPELAAILREDPRLEVSIVETPMLLASPLLSSYDGVLMHYKEWEPRIAPAPEAHVGLQRFVQSGKGLMIVHFACGAFHDWDEYVKVAGRVYDPKLRPHDPYGSFAVKIVDHQHVITAPMAEFSTRDELYTCLAGETPIHVLAEARSVVDQRDYPMAFVLDVGGGHVFFSPLGHDVASLKSPGTRQLFRRGAAWMVGMPPMDGTGPHTVKR